MSLRHRAEAGEGGFVNQNRYLYMLLDLSVCCFLLLLLLYVFFYLFDICSS
eukprot:gene10981-7625_t